MQKTALRFVALVAFVYAALVASAASGQAQQRPADGQQQFADLGVCNLSSGQQISGCRLGYRTWGRLNADRSNAVLFPTWFSGNSESVGKIAAGANLLADPAKYFVVVIDAFGDGVSSSPSNSTAQPGVMFPAFTTRDMVNAQYRLATETLGLKHLHAVMGISMGGMQTFEWMVNYPDFMDEAIPIVGSPKLNSYDLLLWQEEEDALKSDPEWQNGHYVQHPPMGLVEAIHDMHLATPAYFARTVPPEKFAADYESYYATGILPFDANDWLYQLEAMIHHDAAHGASIDEAAKRVKARVLVVSSAQDHMVNPQPALDFARMIGARTIVLQGDCGHIATNCEASTLDPQVRAFLDGK